MNSINHPKLKFDLEEIKQLKKEFQKRGIPFVDRHSHSTTKFTESYDLSKPPPIEGPSLNVLNTAMEIGLEEFAITEHSYEIFLHPKMEERTKLQLRYGNQLFKEYVLYLKRVKEKFPNFNVLGGIELKLRTIEDLEFIDISGLKTLDLILIETGIKFPDFKTIREKLGDEMTILFAHPDPGYSLGNNPEEKDVDEWVENMVQNDIYFDLNRQFLNNFLSDEPVYRTFFKSAIEKGLLFSIGSDYHRDAQNYVKFFTKILKVVDKYGLKKDNFWKGLNR